MVFGSHVIKAVIYFVIACTATELHFRDHIQSQIKKTSSIELHPSVGSEFYLVSVQIGHSTLNLSLDTGSSDLWVFSSNLPSNKRTGHNIYKPSTHAQFLDGYNFTSSYAEGTTVSGRVVVKDYINLGGLETYNQSIEAASDIPSSFVNETCRDGILGLGFGSINTVRPTPQTTFFETIEDQLANPVFAVSLKDDGAGSLDFGFIDHGKYKEGTTTTSLSYAPVNNSDGLWAIRLDGYSVGDDDDSHSKPFNVETAAVDTGTSVLMLPDQIVQDYYAQIPSASNSPSLNGYIFDCDEEIPGLSLHIGDYTATIPSKFMNYAKLGVLNGQNVCYGSLQGQNNLSFSILGHPFLKSQYVVFDMGEMRLGLGEQV